MNVYFKCMHGFCQHFSLNKLLPHAVRRTHSLNLLKKRSLFPLLEGGVDQNASVYQQNARAFEVIRSDFKSKLAIASSGGGEKAIDRHVNRNKKLLAEDRLHGMLDKDGDWLEIGRLAGLGMEYGNIPNAGVLTGIGQVNGIQCMFVVNDATVKGGTIYPIAVKKQLRAQEIAKQNKLPCIYIVDSGGAFLPLQADIFPDKEHGGRTFYNEAIMNSMDIPQLAIVCGNCTAGGAYVPTMAQETVIVDRIGTIFLGGPPLVYAALGEVVSSEQLGGATLHCTVSGCTDHFAKDESEAFELGRGIVDTFGIEITQDTHVQEYEEPIYDTQEMSGLVPHTDQHTMDMTKVLARIVDGSRFSEFKARYGTTVLTGFGSIQGQLVGFVANTGPLTGDAATKGSHFVQMCNQRRIPLIFLQNTTPPSATQQKDNSNSADLGLQIRMHARLMTAVAGASVPKFTVIVGNSFGADNYLMCGRAFEPRFVFSWPNARIAIEEPSRLQDMAVKAAFPEGTVPDDEESQKTLAGVSSKVKTTTSAIYASSRLWDDGVIMPEDTRKVLGNALRIVNQSRDTWKHNVEGVPVMRM